MCSSDLVVIVTVLVAVSFEHPPLPVTTYLIVVLPDDTGVTTPLDAFTVATDVFTELHVPSASVDSNHYRKK